MSNRIAAGELGQITTRQRGGSWAAQANGRDLGGLKRTVYASGDSEKAARKELKRRWAATTQASGQTLTKRSTIADAADVWLSEKASSVSEQSLQIYRNRSANLCLGIGERGYGREVINRHGGVGEMPLRKVTLGWVRREVFRVQQEHGNAAAWAAFATLRAVLHAAAVHEAIPTNPAAGAVSTRDIPRKVDVHALTSVQFQRVWQALEDWPAVRVDKARLQFLVRLGLLAVLRCGEALAVREQDILDDRLVISGTIVQPPKGPAFRQASTKTRLRREVQLTPELRRLLNERREAVQPSPDGLLVASRTGKPVPVVNVGRTLRIFAREHAELFAEIGFPVEEFTFHVLRRTVATHVRERLGTEAAAAVLGHVGTGNVGYYAAAPALVDAGATALLNELFR